MGTLNSLKTTLITSLLWIIILGSAFPAAAQAGRSISISPLDETNYPQMTFYFDVMERDSKLVTELSEEQLTLRENGNEQPINEFRGLNPGIQLVTAFNISPPFAIQDISGKSRFDHIREALIAWANQSSSTIKDDLSLLSNEGLEITHLSSSSSFATSLEEYDPNLRENEANFNVLSRAIEIAADPVDQMGMKRVVLFFTPPVPPEGTAAIDSLISLAKENQVRVYVILVSSPAVFTSNGAESLRNLAEETSGTFQTYSDAAPDSVTEDDPQTESDLVMLPDFNALFQPLRSTFLISYQSQIVTPGNHTLELVISTPLGDSMGQRDFFLDVQPPNPIFLSPPRAIQREAVEPEGEADTELEFLPEMLFLDLIVEFPDGHPRELEELIFRVDGEIVDRKTTPPFEGFEWDLTPYQTSATHYLTLEAVDMLGLSRQSIPTPIDVEVNIPPPSAQSILKNNAPAIGGLMVIVTLSLVFFILITKGRIRPKLDFGASRFFKNRGKLALDSTRKIIKGKNQGGDLQPIRGYRLIPISDVAQQLVTDPIQVWEKETIFGNEPGRGKYYFNHPSVAKIHTRIQIDSEGDITIKDEGSSTGTWINYQQVQSSKPQLIKDGDIIHIGEAGFRFQVLDRSNSEAVIEE